MSDDAKKIDVILKSHQIQLHDILKIEDTNIADWYYSSIVVLSNFEIPHRERLAAHSIREIIEKLGNKVDVPKGLKDFKTNERLNPVLDKFKNIENEKKKNNVNDWFDKKIKSQVGGFLTTFKKFASDFESRLSKRGVQAAGIYSKYDPSQRAIDPVLEKSKVERWNLYGEYFKNLSHGNPSSDVKYFDSYYSEFEVELSNIFRPNVVETQDELDEIIREAEKND